MLIVVMIIRDFGGLASPIWSQQVQVNQQTTDKMAAKPTLLGEHIKIQNEHKFNWFS